jgi:hypothetical protein
VNHVSGAERCSAPSEQGDATARPDLSATPFIGLVEAAIDGTLYSQGFPNHACTNLALISILIAIIALAATGYVNQRLLF